MNYYTPHQRPHIIYMYSYNGKGCASDDVDDDEGNWEYMHTFWRLRCAGSSVVHSTTR